MGWGCVGQEAGAEEASSSVSSLSSCRVGLVPDVQAVHLIGQCCSLPPVLIVSGIDSIRCYIGHEVT